MAVSIVSNPSTNDNQAPQKDFLDTENTVVANDSDDTNRINQLNPQTPAMTDIEETPVSDTIPNMYIAADKQAIDVEKIPDNIDIFSTNPEPEQNTPVQEAGINIDDLLAGGSGTITTETPVEQATKDPLIQDSQIPPATMDAKIAKKAPMQKKWLLKTMAKVAAVLSLLLIVWFVGKTMFPIGLDGDGATEDTLVAVHSVAEEIPVEIPEVDEEPTIKDQLVQYAALGELYYNLGLDSKNRDIVRHGLYIEKRAKDLLDTLDLDPDMDTRDIVIYFAQFDDYLQILEKWESGEWAKDAPLIQEDIVDTVPQEDSVDDDLNQADWDDLYYYDKGDKIPLEIIPWDFAIKFQKGTTPEQAKNVLEKYNLYEWSSEDLTQIDTIPFLGNSSIVNLNNTLRLLNNEPIIEYASPALKLFGEISDTKLFIGTQITFVLKDKITIDEVKKT